MNPDREQPKPFDIRERALRFAAAVATSFPPKRDLTHPALRAWCQVFNSASSTGAHLEEAAAAGTRPYFVALNRGALREMRESRFWLRLIKVARLGGHNCVEPLLAESGELVAILATIVKNAQGVHPNHRR